MEADVRKEACEFDESYGLVKYSFPIWVGFVCFT